MKAETILLAGHPGYVKELLLELVAGQKDWAVTDTTLDPHEIKHAIKEARPDVIVVAPGVVHANVLSLMRDLVSVVPAPKILVVATDNDSRLALRAVEAGASGYLLAEYAFDELEEAVETVMNGRTYLSPGIAGMAYRGRAWNAPPPEGGPESQAEVPRQSRSPGQVRILVVDDELSVRKTVSSMLSRAGYEVECVATAEEAIHSINMEMPDLAVVDLVLPVSSGVAVIKEIRARQTFVPIAIITGYPDSELLTQALQYSPFTVLKKPFTSEALLQTVRSLLGQMLTQRRGSKVG